MGVIGATLPSPVGTVLVVQRDDALAAVHLGAEGPLPVRLGSSDLLIEAVAQLRAYFAGELREFQLPVQAEGTAFQQRVWEHLRTIPWGTTRTYAAVAAALGLRPGAARAVGAANGANPVAIIVPCHRVIGADGSLTGYGGGLERKESLLRLEGTWSPTEQPALF